MATRSLVMLHGLVLMAPLAACGASQNAPSVHAGAVAVRCSPLDQVTPFGSVGSAEVYSEANVAAYRRRIENDPGDVAARGYLFAYLSSPLRDATPEERRLGAANYAWLVEHCAPAELLGNEAAFSGLLLPEPVDNHKTLAELWKRRAAANPKNSKVLMNAGTYLVIDGEESDAIALLEDAAALEPHNAECLSALANVYRIRSQGDAGRAYQLLRSALEHSSGEARLAILSRLVYVALDEEDWNGAKCFADELLGTPTTSPSSRYAADAHVVLGLLQIRWGKPNAAADELLAVANHLKERSNCFGPPIELATSLWHAGQTDAVRRFLKECGSGHPDETFDEWIQEIDQGRAPGFAD